MNTMNKKELSSSIKERIRRIQEKLMLEELPSFTFAEQFAYLIYLRVKKSGLELSRIELPLMPELYFMRLEENLDELKREADAPDFIRDAQILENRGVLVEMWDLITEVMREYPDLQGKQDFELLAPVVEFIFETIARKNRNIFLTPLPLVRAMCRMAGCKETDEVWDPACGTGSFLVESCARLKQNRAAKADGSAETAPNVFELQDRRVTGTDFDERMIRAARINRFFHGIPENRIQLLAENAFDQYGREAYGVRKFDVIISNPPVISTQENAAGAYVPPVLTKKVNLQFLQLIMDSLKKDGRAAVLVNENVLFSDQPTEVAVRKRLVEECGLQGVISLPQGTFAPYTGGKSSILLFGGGETEAVFFYEMKKLGYSLNAKREPEAENDIPQMLLDWENREALFMQWKEAYDAHTVINDYHVGVPGEWDDTCRWFGMAEEIREQNYNLTGEMYRRQKSSQAELPKPKEILVNLARLEQETMDRLEELMEMIKDYE